MKIKIRNATKEDMQQVHNLIVELAIFEKEPDEVEIDEKDLQKMGFEYETPAFHCFVAEVENKVVGAAIIYKRFSTWKGETLHLEDLVLLLLKRENNYFKVMKIKIRNATKEDMQQVHNLIVELAIFEKEPDEVEIDEKDLQKMGFEYETPAFHCFVAEVENKVVGAAIIYKRFSTWKGETLHLEDLVVTKNMRGQGIGGKLFDKVILFGKESGAKRISWNVIDWNKNAIEFYINRGAKIVEGWSIVHLSGKNLENYN